MKEVRVVWVEGGDNELRPAAVLEGMSNQVSDVLTRLVNDGWTIDKAVAEASWNGFWLVLVRDSD